MKTIFITSFDGVETKNVLRSSIFSTILEDKNTRVVVFVKNEKRALAHKNEFGDNDRILYEVVENVPIVGLDRFFGWLKFAMLKTTTTDLRRFIRYKVEGGLLQYLSGLFINRLLANRWCLALSRRLDYFLVKNHTYDKFFEKYEPDLVFLANIFYEPEVHFLRAAKKYKVKNIGFINSWDKITGRCVLRIVPNKFVVFNDQVREELAAFDGAKDENIFVGGVPQYDVYFNSRASSREEFCKRVKIAPENKILVYAPIGGAYSDSDWKMIDLLNQFKKEGHFGKNTEILVRFHPYDIVDPKEISKRPYLKYDYVGMRFSDKISFDERGEDWELDTSELERLRDTLYHMSLLICYASSLSIEAAIFDKPVINLNFELDHGVTTLRSPTQYYRMTHYKKALRTGGIKLVDSPEKLTEWASRYINSPEIDKEGRAKLVREQCQFMDGNSGERIGKFILSNLWVI